MGSPPSVVEFDPYEPAVLLERMEELAAAGHGWINLAADADADAQAAAAAGAGLFRIFSARGPAVPFCTWVARERTRKQVEYVSIGVQHGSGPKALARLAEQGHALPEGWLVLQDHPKRGLVVALPVDTPHDAVLRWLVLAARLLSTETLPDRWHAAVYT
jgi:hypothetical protein